MGPPVRARLAQVQAPPDHAESRRGARGRHGDELLSYLVTAFLSTDEPPPAREAREYLLEGALFDQRPEISVDDARDGSFDRMELRYDATRRPMVLRRLRGADADAVRGEAIDLATMRGCDD